ncbi:MAG: DUF4156 domain-containing protein [Chromatiales bacterium]|jgi:hypothetical protein|nr:DUF4156 domain-containing protein [Chromatiales bacterium]
MKRIIMVGAVAALFLQGCAWVSLTPEGERARVLSAASAQSCNKVGMTTSTTRSHLVGFRRKRSNVQEELLALARNSAPSLGGDAVVPLGEPQNGRQSFDVYRCM